MHVRLGLLMRLGRTLGLRRTHEAEKWLYRRLHMLLLLLAVLLVLELLLLLLLRLLLLLLRGLFAHGPARAGEDVQLQVFVLHVFAASYTPCDDAASVSSTIREERLEDCALLPAADERVLLRRILDSLQQGTATVGPQVALY